MRKKLLHHRPVLIGSETRGIITTIDGVRLDVERHRNTVKEIQLGRELRERAKTLRSGKLEYDLTKFKAVANSVPQGTPKRLEQIAARMGMPRSTAHDYLVRARSEAPQDVTLSRRRKRSGT